MHMFEQTGGPDGGSVTLLRPDGTQFPGSPFTEGVCPPRLQPSWTAMTTFGFPTCDGAQPNRTSMWCAH